MASDSFALATKENIAVLCSYAVEHRPMRVGDLVRIRSEHVEHLQKLAAIDLVDVKPVDIL